MSVYHSASSQGEAITSCEGWPHCPRGTSTPHYLTMETATMESYKASATSHTPSFAAEDIAVERLPRTVKQNASTAHLPAGEYFVGDPCYAVGEPGSLWQKWVDVAGADSEGFLHGICGATYNGMPIVGANTMYGDGSYLGSDGVTYAVDAGMIGVTPMDLLRHLREANPGLEENDLEGLGSVVEFTEPFTVACDATGTITIGSIVIETS